MPAFPVFSGVVRKTLEALTRAGNTAQKIARRARIALLASDGNGNSEISRKLGINRKTAILWRHRASQLSAGTPPPELADRPRKGTPRTATPEMVERIVQTTLGEKPEGCTHWSTRTLAKHLRVSKMMVQRVWKSQQLKPHRTKRFKLSKDKRFLEKLKDVVGVYLNPPPNSVVYCVDEKSQIQALDRTQPGLPWKKGRCGTWTHDYKRHGTTTLFAAYNVADGKVIGECHPRHTNQEFLGFLRRLDRETPKGLQVHIIIDNASSHKHENVNRWLKRHRRFHFHFIPTSSSWTNLVERWFALLTDKCVRRGVFHSVNELELKIVSYLNAYNVNPQPFRWRATVDQIVEKIRRAAQAAGLVLPWMPQPVPNTS